MNTDGSLWQADDGDSEMGEAEDLGIRIELMASASDSRIREERGAPAYECQRRKFANGPAAREAAGLLHQALHLPSPQAVVADFGQRATRRVCYRFVDRSRVGPTRRRDQYLQN